MISGTNFNQCYKNILRKLNEVGTTSTTRKGAKITELFDQSFHVKSPMDCLAHCRNLSTTYLKGELNFYLSGSDSVEDAAKISKFWLKCTDDGKTINSNYGKLIFHDRNAKGFTQFEHALNCLKNNPQSKKAVMTLYDKENAYISNDNPCTMFLRARLDADNRLHLSVYMRSSDVYFGLPYDVPFFVFVQFCLAKELNVNMGTYTHHACTLHKYEYKEKLIKEILSGKFERLRVKLDVYNLFDRNYEKLKRIQFMQFAWRESEKAECLKKHVGACFTEKTDDIDEYVVATTFGGPHGLPCTKCAREDNEDKYFGDECPSIHAEMKAIISLYKIGFTDFSNVSVYVTHGPCDACLKLMDEVGIRKVYYDKPYKTNYAHWPRIKVCQINEDCS